MKVNWNFYFLSISKIHFFNFFNFFNFSLNLFSDPSGWRYTGQWSEWMKMHCTVIRVDGDALYSDPSGWRCTGQWSEWMKMHCTVIRVDGDALYSDPSGWRCTVQWSEWMKMHCTVIRVDEDALYSDPSGWRCTVQWSEWMKMHCTVIRVDEDKRIKSFYSCYVWNLQVMKFLTTILMQFSLFFSPINGTSNKNVFDSINQSTYTFQFEFFCFFYILIDLLII